MSQLQNSATQAGHLSTGRTDLPVIELFNQQQALQRDTNTPISMFPTLQTQYS